MSPDEQKSKAVLKAWRIPPELMERIENYRFENRFKTETEAILALLDSALTRWEQERK